MTSSAAFLYTCHTQAQPASKKTCVSVTRLILNSCVLYATAACRLFGFWSGACTCHVDFIRLDVVRVRALCRLLLRWLLWNRFASCRMQPDMVSALPRVNILVLCALPPSVNVPCCCAVAACLVWPCLCSPLAANHVYPCPYFRCSSLCYVLASPLTLCSHGQLKSARRCIAVPP